MAKTRKKRIKETKTVYSTGFIKAMVKIVLYIVIVLVLSGFAGYFLISAGNDFFAFVKDDEPVTVTVPEGTDVKKLADILGEKGIIKYPTLFKLYASLKKSEIKIVPGEYEVSPLTNYSTLMSSFRPHYVRTVVRLTIPEGFSVDEIIDLFVSNGIGDREGFIDAINNADFSEFRFVRMIDETEHPGRFYRLEGYLYPDTYEFYSDANPAQVIYKLLANFDRKFKEVYYTRAEEIGLTVDQVITIASLIQEEAYYLEEFEKVSSVFHNRLKNTYYFPKIESDATVVYAVQIAEGERPEKVAPFLTFESPYNTYLHEGLPPGPISNPGYDAIVTAIYPAATDYYYFYTNRDKRITFSRTLAEHQAAIAADVEYDDE